MNWLQKIAQEYPSRNPNFAPEKLEYLGYPHSPRHTEKWDQEELAVKSQLSAIPSDRVKFAINHLAEKYIGQTEDFIRAFTENFCEMDTSWSWEDGSQNIVKQIYSDVTEISNNLARRSEITDPELAGILANFIQEKVLVQITSLAKRSVANDVFWVRVYGKNDAYGGPEEGGWTYTDMQSVQEEQIRGLEAACQRKAQLEKEYANRGKDTFYEDLEAGHGNVVDVYDQQSSQNMGELDYSGDTEGMQFPTGWTPSAFANFIVQVELTKTPLSEVKVPPHYE